MKIDGLLKNEKKTWKLSDNISFKTQKRNDVTKSSTTTFFADNVYSRAVSSSRNKNLNIGFSAAIVINHQETSRWGLRQESATPITTIAP